MKIPALKTARQPAPGVLTLAIGQSPAITSFRRGPRPGRAVGRSGGGLGSEGRVSRVPDPLRKWGLVELVLPTVVPIRRQNELLDLGLANRNALSESAEYRDQVISAGRVWKAGTFPCSPVSSARLAQLVEHYLDTVGVTGSSPVPRTIFLFIFCLQLNPIPLDFLCSAGSERSSVW